MNGRLWRISLYGILAFVVIIALVIRFVFILYIPAFPDEVELLKELQRIAPANLPVHFYGYGWGEHVILAYLAIPFIRFFNTPELLTIRFIAAISYAAMLFFLYQLLRSWASKFVGSVAVIVALCLPWGIILSTVGFNVSLIPVLFLCALWCLEQYIQQKKKYLLSIACLAMSISFYTYGVALLFLPLFSLWYWWVRRDYFTFKTIMVYVAAWCLITIPILLVHVQSAFDIQLIERIGSLTIPYIQTSRFSGVSIFVRNMSLPVEIGYYAMNYVLHFVFIALLYDPIAAVGNLSGSLFGISFFPFGFLFHARPLSLWWGTWLYHTTLAYPWDVISIPLGIVFLKHSILERQARHLLYGWLVLYPIGPSLGFADFLGFTPSRDVYGLPLLIIFSAVGVAFCLEKIGLLPRRSDTA